MKKVMFVLAMLSLGTLCWAGSAREDATDRLENATTVVHEIMGTPDKGIPEEVLEHAKCVAVVPHMVKGGFIFGGKGGKGVATCRTANGWSSPAFITISGGSWGLQIGVEAVDIRQDSDSRHAIYGSNVTTRALLLGKVAAPSAVQPFLAEIRGAKAQAVTEEKSEARKKDKD